MLWLLLTFPLLIGAYVAILRRRKRAAIRYSSLLLVRAAVRGQRFRRHVPPALFLLSMLAALLGIARPTASVVLPSQYMTIALAMDVSRSMQATDVEPTRISAAQVAAKAFIEDLPRNVRLGIVSFAGTANVVQTPTDNKQDMLDAIDRFQLQRATATGSGLILALSMLFPEEGIDIESVIASQARARGHAGGAAPIDRTRKVEEKKVVQPVAPGSHASGVIILLSDGRRTAGPDPIEVAKMAAERGVRVYTVGFGTIEGTTISMDNYSFYVRLDEETLKAVAKMTGGEYFHAGTGADLKKVYANLSTKLSMERKETEISSLFSAVAALLALLSVMLSVLWFHRGARPAISA
ncbi:MAG: VWA domain-containing protein [Burkholderiaceae bacterium]|nr:VWA domain-containing protein [Burkholderiaceae bacterium]